jgi:maltose O-acetyltransferase
LIYAPILAQTAWLFQSFPNFSSSNQLLAQFKHGYFHKVTLQPSLNWRIMIGFFRKIRRKYALLKPSSAKNAYCCKLANNARILCEGSIENLQSNPQAICVGEGSVIRGKLLVYRHGGKIIIGQHCYLGYRSDIWSMGSVIIGDRVLISHDCQIHDGTAHSLDPLERSNHFKQILETGHPQTYADLPGVRSSPVVIGDDVWISFGVTILKGVTIGSGCVIAARSIVTCDVPPRSLYRNQVTPVIKLLD